MSDTKSRDLQGLKIFRSSLRRFQDAIDGVRELAEFAEKGYQDAFKGADDIEVSISPAVGAPSKEKAREAAAALAEFFQSAKVLASKALERGVKPTDETSKAEFSEIIQGMSSRLKAASTEDFDASKYILETVTVYRRRNRLNVLRSSLLTSAVGDFEVLFATIVGMYFQLRPQALSSKEPQFSWEDIQKYDSLEELRSFHADRQVEQLMWKGFDEWMEWLDKKLKIKFVDICADVDVVAEVFQRRHVIVHNGGKVSRQYLNKAPRSVSGVEVGDDLDVTSEYLDEALVQLYILGVLMTSSVADRLIQDGEVRSVMQSQLSNIVGDALKHERWKVVARLCETYMESFDASIRKDSMRVNLWVAKKHTSGLEAIREAVEDWDVSSLRREFELAKLALLDGHEEAYGLACELAAQGALEESDFSSDPLYDSLRSWVQSQERPSPFPEKLGNDANEVAEMVAEEFRENGLKSEEVALESERDE
ncbi:hypothetical protein [Streptomyces sp. NPDC091294]|uniref:hypothetical protein n=1 Tax=Streptomyces sp. NPDC091294 TaxID=3365992 RepID=UPI0037FA787F